MNLKRDEQNKLAWIIKEKKSSKDSHQIMQIFIVKLPHSPTLEHTRTPSTKYKK